MSATTRIIWNLALLITSAVSVNCNLQRASAKVSTCEQQALTSRILLEPPLVTSSRFECFSRCARDVMCQTAVRTIFANGDSTCSKYSAEGTASSSMWSDTNVVTCVMMQMTSQCYNNGQFDDPICVCSQYYTGSKCELENPPCCYYALESWADVYSIDGDARSAVMSLMSINDTHLKNWKIGYNDTALETFSVYQIDSVNMNRSSSSFEAFALDSVHKTSWNRFDAVASRVLYRFSFNDNSLSSKVTSITTVPVDEKMDYCMESLPFDLMISKQQRFHIQVDFNDSSQEPVLLDYIEKGYEVFGTSTVKYMRSTPIYESSYKRLVIDDDNEKAEFHFYKYYGGGGPNNYHHLYSSIMGKGTNNSVSSQDLNVNHIIFFSPCWRIFGEGLEIGSEDFTSHLTATLKQGHSFRLNQLGLRIATGVLSVLIVKDKIHFFLEQMQSDKTIGDFSLGTTDIKTIISIPDTIRKCQRNIESEDNNMKYYISPTGLHVIVDTRKWTRLFQVFSNSSVSYGHVTDLADAVTSGRDINVWLHWNEKEVDEFFRTSVNSVTKTGQVSSESVTLWQHTSLNNPPLKFTSTCDLRKILVSSQGHVEVMEYDLYIPGSIRVETDVKITWFTN